MTDFIKTKEFTWGERISGSVEAGSSVTYTPVYTFDIEYTTDLTELHQLTEEACRMLGESIAKEIDKQIMADLMSEYEAMMNTIAREDKDASYERAMAIIKGNSFS